MSSADLSRDLAVLQDRAGLPAPLILVASSIGGLTAEMFARQFPERIAGLVFLDAATSDSLRDLSPSLGRARAAATAGSVAAHLGLIRLLDPFHIPADSEDGRRTAAMTYGSKAIDAFGVVVGGLPRSVQEFDDAPALPGDVRLVVLSASDPDTGSLPWPAHTLAALSHAPAASQQALAKASTRGSWILVPDTNQPIATAQPEVVIEHVVSMIEATRGTTVGRVRRR
jgi:pimeloyl-ACP methyl ester carboxylesterase